MTFEELIEEETASEVYSGTDVDAATQAALLEWLFDLYLSGSEDENFSTTKWMRYFKRQLNVNYPIYLDYLSVTAAAGQLDAFVTEYMERVHSGTDTDTGSGSSSTSKTLSDTTRDEVTVDDTTVRTPNLTTASTANNTNTRNLSDVTDSDSTDTNTTNVEESATSEGKARNINIAYPEANLSSIPTDIDNMPTAIDYASSENDNVNKNENAGESETVSSGSSTNDTTVTSTGTVTDNGTSSQTQTGTDTTDFDGSTIRTGTKSGTETNTSQSANSNTAEHESEDTDEGRHEAAYDILPRVIKSLTTAKPLIWLVKELQKCFDNFGEM